jgi:hypothetical protein
MGRLTGDNIEQFRSYSGDGSNNRRKFLSLKDKGSTARGRIVCEKAEDVECYVVHRVKVGDYEREVNCLYEQGGSIEDCPFCKAKLDRSAKIYIPFFDEADGEIKIFERPNSFYSKISSYCSRFAPIVSYDIEIVRNHEKDSKKPDFDIFPGKSDGATVEDILDDAGVEELPKILGVYVLDKTADDMEYYLEHNEFPETRSEDTPIRRGSSSEEERPRRRGRSGDRF